MVLTAGALALAGAANAHASAEPSDAELDLFAATLVGLQHYMIEYRSEASAAESDAQVREIRRQYEASIPELKSGAGLTVERYHEIFRAAQGNPALGRRITDRVLALQAAEQDIQATEQDAADSDD